MKTKNILAGLLATAMIAPMVTTHAATMTELESASKLAGMGVINSGSTSADFGLANTITRKEIMKIVMNLSGKTVTDECNGDFSDVTNDWGCKYIESALGYGYIADNATFRPDDSISKAEAMKLVLQAKGIEKAYNTNDWQADYMNTALDNGLIKTTYSDHNTAALRGWIFSIGAAESSDSMMHDDVMMKDGEDAMMDKMEDTMMKDQMTGYKDYDESLLGQNDTTVLFFHAAWCPSCRALDSNLEASGTEDILVLKTDFDSETDLRKKYGVVSQHTFVQVDANGEMVTKWSGANDIEDILEKVQ